MPLSRWSRLCLALLLAAYLCASAAVIVGQLLILDAIRPSFLPYTDYLPGQPRPALGCTDVWDLAYEYYGIAFTCTVQSEVVLQVYGNEHTITGVWMTFSGVRVGDLLILLGDPLPRPDGLPPRSRARYYVYAGGRTYVARPYSQFAPLKFVSFWKAAL